MNEPLPAETLGLETKERKPLNLQVFGIHQVVEALLDKEHISPYKPIDQLKDPDELNRRAQQLEYCWRYSLFVGEKQPDELSNMLSELKKKIGDRIQQMTEVEFLDQLSQSCGPDDFYSLDTSLANLTARLMVLETLTDPPSWTDRKEYVKEIIKLQEEALVKISAARLVNGWIEERGFVGMEAKILEYFERINLARSRNKELGFSRETVVDLTQDLAQLGYDYEVVKEHATKYRLPPLEKVIGHVNNHGKVDKVALAEYALVSRASPIAREVFSKPFDYNEIEIDSVGNIVIPHFGEKSFSPERLLIACLTAQDGKIFYPADIDDQGRILKVEIFHLLPLQIYEIKRKCERALRKYGQPPICYLKKVKIIPSSEGKTIISQEGEKGEIFVEYPRGDFFHPSSEKFKDGLLNFPVNSNTTVNFFYLEDPLAYVLAQYKEGVNAFVVTQWLFEKITYSQTFGGSFSKQLLEVARHEFAHSIFSDRLSSEERKTIMDLFQPGDPNFDAFVKCFAEKRLYRDIAMVEYRKNPNQDYIEVPDRDGLIKLAKERIVDELLAYASGGEVFTEEELKLSESFTATNLLWYAVACLRNLPSHSLETLNQLLNKGFDEFNNFFNALQVAIKIFMADNSPSYGYRVY